MSEKMDKALSVLSDLYDKVELIALKCFRGLLMEKKEGGWELSKGNVAFWIVLTHCMMAWSGKATQAVAKVATAAADTVDAGTAEAIGSGLLDGLSEIGGPVPEQEYWFLLALLGYAGVKTTKGGLTNALGALRGK